MCRLLAVVSSELTDFRFSLSDAPRSLAVLSGEHPHGWGIAVHRSGQPVMLHKRPVAAKDCEHFDAVAAQAVGEVLVAHVRQRTVGPVGIANTHPFQRGRWTFAHNGTIHDVDWMHARTSAARLAEIEGETDSERLLAMLLTELDAVGASTSADGVDRAVLDEALARLTRECRARAGFGAANFILTDGEVLYAHRFGRTLHLLERVKPTPTVHAESRETGAALDMHARGSSSRRRRAILVASEQMTPEPWIAIDDGTLVRVDRGADQPRTCFVTP